MHLFAYLAVVNLLTLLMYWLDKRAARRGAPRTPEYVLLLVGFIGGTVAAIVAQQWFRHKNRKQSFQVKFWALTVLQIGLILFPPTMLKLAVARLAA